jgi:prepilin-type N-terminal cleavage/methylation domain-containing protein
MSNPIRILRKLEPAFFLRSRESVSPGLRSRDPGQSLERFVMNRRGFTLLEMLVSLIIGTLIVGAVMGLISVSMQHKYRIREKSQIQPILESAAQIILADPIRAGDGNIRLGELSGAPVVGVSVVPVEVPEGGLGDKAGQLCRIMLSYKSGQLEFSVLVPPADSR